MTNQDIFNAAFALLGALGGWWLKVILNALTELQGFDRELSDKLSRVEVLVAGNYVRRDEFERSMQRLLDKLDAIEAKLDRKVDK